MCLLQFILTLLYFVIENVLTIITYTLSLSCFYYKSRWRLYTSLQILDSSNPIQHKIKTKAPPKSDTNDKNTLKTRYSNSVPENDADEEKGYEIQYDDEDTTEAKNYKTINILTQNLWVHYLAPSPCKTQRISAFIRFLRTAETSYDILIIQEIFALRFFAWVRCNDLEYLVCELYKIGYIHCTKPSGKLPYFGQNGGVLLFSKYPLIYDDIFTFNKSDEIMLRKGFAIAIAKIPITPSQYYHICIGTCHCDPYRPNVILSQIQHFSEEIASQNKEHGFDIVVGGDFNTRNKALTKGLKEYFENILNMYNVWSIEINDANEWNNAFVTYRGSYLSKCRVWLAILSCGLYRLPSLNLNEMRGQSKQYKNGYCLDHLLTNIDKTMVQNISVVDTRYKNIFVSDHLGVQLIIRVPIK